MTYRDFQAELHLVTNYLLEQKGYSTIEGIHFDVRKTDIMLWATLTDDFNEKRDFRNFDANGMDELWAELNTLPNRAERELRYLLSRCGDAAEALDKLRNEAAREFALELIEKRAVYANLLASPASTLPDDEIPF